MNRCFTIAVFKSMKSLWGKERVGTCHLQVGFRWRRRAMEADNRMTKEVPP